MVEREEIQKIEDEIIGREPGLIYVYGPQGVGKSYSLYHFVCKQKKEQKSRVMYLPNCLVLKINPYQHIFKAILSAFSSDNEFIEKYFEFLSLVDELKILQKLFELINQYCETNQISFYVVIDQFNSLKQNERETIPLNFVQWNGFFPKHKVIISVSANNDDSAFYNFDSQMLLVENGYTANELVIWQSQFGFYPGLFI